MPQSATTGAVLLPQAAWRACHTHNSVLSRGLQEWSYLRGGLTTVDRDYGIFSQIHHSIGIHVLHHLFPQVSVRKQPSRAVCQELLQSGPARCRSSCAACSTSVNGSSNLAVSFGWRCEHRLNRVAYLPTLPELPLAAFAAALDTGSSSSMHRWVPLKCTQACCEAATLPSSSSQQLSNSGMSGRL